MININYSAEIEKKDISYIHRKATQEFEKLSNSRILLTGCGFLSYYIIKSIASWNQINKNKKIRLVVYSRFKNDIPSWLKKIKKYNIEIKKVDVTKLKLKKYVVFDYIIHAASVASPIAYRKDPINTIFANVSGLHTILNYMLLRKKTAQPVKGLLYFSSSEIYGDPTPEHISTPESYYGNVSCTGPRACYDESKRFCETLCTTYTSFHNLPIKIARPFNNYGPGLKLTDGRVIPDFAKDILNDNNIVMYSNGSPTRTFCYVADSIVGYLKILIRGKVGEAYNIGVAQPEISISELAKLIIRIAKAKLNYNGKIIIKKSKDKHYLTDNPNRRCPKIDKAVKELDFKPEITLSDGLTRLLMWYKNSQGSSL